MNTSLLQAQLGSRTAWYAGVAFLFLAVSGVALWRPLVQRYFPEAIPTVPIEDVLWTATPDYKTFFGPGTEPSTEIAARLRSMKDDYGLPEEVYRFPNAPVFVSPRIFMADGSSKDIILYSPLTPIAARAMRSEFLHGQPTNKR